MERKYKKFVFRIAFFVLIFVFFNLFFFVRVFSENSSFLSTLNDSEKKQYEEAVKKLSESKGDPKKFGYFDDFLKLFPNVQKAILRENMPDFLKVFENYNLEERKDIFKKNYYDFMFGFKKFLKEKPEDAAHIFHDKNKNGDPILDNELKNSIWKQLGKEEQENLLKNIVNMVYKKSGFVLPSGAPKLEKVSIFASNLEWRENRIGFLKDNKLRSWIDLEGKYSFPFWTTEIEFHEKVPDRLKDGLSKAGIEGNFIGLKYKTGLKGDSQFSWDYFDGGTRGYLREIVGPNGVPVFEGRPQNFITELANQLSLDPNHFGERIIGESIWSAAGGLAAGLEYSAKKMVSSLANSLKEDDFSRILLSLKGLNVDNGLNTIFSSKGEIYTHFDDSSNLKIALSGGAILNQGNKLFSQFYSKDGDENGFYKTEPGKGEEFAVLNFDKNGNVVDSLNFRVSSYGVRDISGFSDQQYTFYSSRGVPTSFFTDGKSHPEKENRIEINPISGVYVDPETRRVRFIPTFNVYMYGDGYKTFQTFRDIYGLYVDQTPGKAGVEEKTYVRSGNSLLVFNNNEVYSERSVYSSDYNIWGIATPKNKDNPLRFSTGDWGYSELYYPNQLIMKSNSYGYGEVITKGLFRMRIPFVFTNVQILGPPVGDMAIDPNSKIVITNIATPGRPAGLGGRLIQRIAAQRAMSERSPLSEFADEMNQELDNQYNRMIENREFLESSLDNAQRLLIFAKKNGLVLYNEEELNDQISLGKKMLEGRDAFKNEFAPILAFIGGRSLGWGESIIIGPNYIEIAGERFKIENCIACRQLLRELSRNSGRLTRYRTIYK